MNISYKNLDVIKEIFLCKYYNKIFFNLKLSINPII